MNNQTKIPYIFNKLSQLIFFILFFSNPIFGNKLIWVNENLKNFKAISANEKIPNKLIKSIDKWRRKNIIKHQKKKFKVFKFQRKFKIARKNENYISGDVIFNQSLPQRQLIFAASYGKIWIIAYKLGGNQFRQNKFLYFDLDNPSAITVYELNGILKNYSDFKERFAIHLKKNSNAELIVDFYEGKEVIRFPFLILQFKGIEVEQSDPIKDFHIISF